MTDTERSSETSHTSATQPSVDDAELLRLYPRLRRFAAVVAPAEVEPDDLVQEALERLFAHGTEGIEHLEAYVRQIMVRAASNHRRRLGRGRRAIDRFTRRDATAVAADDAYPSDVDFLDALAPVSRAVLYLREVEGREVRDVATQVALSEASVKQIAHRARVALRRHLDDGHDHPPAAEPGGVPHNNDDNNDNDDNDDNDNDNDDDNDNDNDDDDNDNPSERHDEEPKR